MNRNAVGLIALLLVVSLPAFAEEAADHPLIGRFEAAVIHHQEVSRFGEYTIAVGEEETYDVQGEVWMTLYDAPADSSTFSVYSTYLSFLEQERFEILLSYKPGEAPGRYLRDVYERAPFADHGNYNHSAPITNGNAATAAYIAARRESDDGTIWVSVAIASGWYAYPQYKLDVVQSASDSGRIVSTGTRPAADPEDADRKGTTATAAPDAGAGGLFSGTGSFRVRSGIGGFMFLDPAFAGALTETSGSVDPADDGVNRDGFKNVYGPFVELTWFLNRNLGLAADFSRLASDEEFTNDGTTYQSIAELMIFRLSALSRMVGVDYPSTVGLGFGGGIAVVSLRQLTKSESINRYTHGEAFLPVVSASAEMAIPIAGFAHLSSGIEYLFMPFTTFTIVTDGSAYSRTFHEGNLGGLTLRIALVAEF